MFFQPKKLHKATMKAYQGKQFALTKQNIIDIYIYIVAVLEIRINNIKVPQIRYLGKCMCS